MKKFTFNNLLLLALVLATFCGIVTTGTVKADSNYVTVADGYIAVDHNLGGEYFQAFSMIDENSVLINAAGGDLKIVTLDTGEEIANFGQPTDYYSAYFSTSTSGFTMSTSFVKKSPIDNSYWVGFTTLDAMDNDERIYQVSPNGTWDLKAMLRGNCDLNFYGNDILVSALDSNNWNDPNKILKLDTTGADNHQTIINADGNSAGFGMSSDGLYYATCFADDEGVYHFSDESVQAALAGGPVIELGQDNKLVSMARGAYDTKVDSEGHVIFDVNVGGSSTEILLYDKTTSELLSIAFHEGEDTAFLCGLDVQGNLLEPGGTVYVATGDCKIIKITAIVPEPNMIVLLLIMVAAGLVPALKR